MARERKSFPLRISKEIYAEIRTWADAEMRSVNSQIEFILKSAIEIRKKTTSPKKKKTSHSEERDD